MASLNQIFSTTNSALQADQAAISVVAGNTANVNTPGYTTRSVQFAAVDHVSINGGAVNAGVAVSNVSSQRDRLLNQRIDQQTQDSAASAARLSALEDLQSIFSGALNATTGTGTGGAASDVGQQLTGFFTSFSSLAANPGNVSLRNGVLTAAHSLAATFNQASSSLTQQRAGLDATVGSIADQVNALTASIAKLNSSISSESPNADAGALEDQRQYDIQQLSQLVGIHQITNEGNSLTITTTGGAVLVAGGTSNVFQTQNVSGVTDLVLGANNQTAALAAGGGRLGGVLEARDQDIPATQQSLDQLASTVAISVNAQQASGLDANGALGAPIFSVSASVSGAAGSIAVVLTDPAGVAAAGSGGGTQDGSNANALASLARSGIVGGQTPGDAYAALISGIGSAVSLTTTLQSSQAASLTQLQTQQSTLSSVNLNDQAALLQSFEESYQAAAKVFSILNTVYASALNLGVQTSVA